MNIKFNRHRIACRAVMLLALIGILTILSTRIRANAGNCGGNVINLPFTDVTSNNIFFCAIAEAYLSGLTNGTSATTFSPAAPVPREQMAAFITRTLDQSLKRGSRRAALGQWWTQQSINSTALTTVGAIPEAVVSNGADLWVANSGSGSVSRVRASDGKLLETWTGMVTPKALLVTDGRIYVTGDSGNTGKLWAIDPDQPAGNAVFLADVGDNPVAMAYDGEHLMIASASGSLTNYHTPSGSKITYSNNFPLPGDILYDGTNFWITDKSLGNIRKVMVSGQSFQDTPIGVGAEFLAFDGTNLWVMSPLSNQITVVRAATGAVVTVLNGNELNGPSHAAFDGERILVTNKFGDSVSLWRATDLTPLGTFATGAGSEPFGACSDGLNFWVTCQGTNKLARY